MGIKSSSILSGILAMLMIISIVPALASASMHNTDASMGFNPEDNNTTANFTETQTQMLDSLSARIVMLQNMYDNVSNATTMSDLNNATQMNRMMQNHTRKQNCTCNNTPIDQPVYIDTNKTNTNASFINETEFATVMNINDANYDAVKTQLLDTIQNMTTKLQEKEQLLTDDNDTDMVDQIDTHTTALNDLSDKINNTENATELQDVVFVFVQTNLVDATDMIITDFQQMKNDMDVNDTENMTILDDKIANITVIQTNISDATTLDELKTAMLNSFTSMHMNMMNMNMMNVNTMNMSTMNMSTMNMSMANMGMMNMSVAKMRTLPMGMMNLCIMVDMHMLPMNNTMGQKDIIETATDAGNFTTLLTALNATNLTDTLKGKGPFTVFAPTDKAFSALPTGTVEALLNNTSALKNILLYHVAGQRLMAKDVANMSNITTLEGQKLPVNVTDQGVFVGNATITMVDINASNGVIHVIDTVLMPQQNTMGNNTKGNNTMGNNTMGDNTTCYTTKCDMEVKCDEKAQCEATVKCDTPKKCDTKTNVRFTSDSGTHKAAMTSKPNGQTQTCKNK